MSDESRICLGVITGVHGIKGEVKVKSFTQNPRDIAGYGILEDKSGTKNFDIKVAGNSKELLRVKIKGIDDRNSAEALAGTELYVSKSVLPELKDEDEFYHTDLIGLAAKLEGEEIGHVSGVYNFGAGDIIEIKINSTSKTEMIPFNNTYVPEVNINDGYIIIASIALNFAKDEGDES